MLFALLLGMALHFLAEEGRCLPGIQLASSVVLRTGVALLGLRITVSQVEALGWSTIAIVVATVAVTIVAGLLIARALKLGDAFGTLTGGAVAICGASAALAIASILPRHRHAERDASFTVIGVTAMSTLAMILYPMIVVALGFDDRAAGAGDGDSDEALGGGAAGLLGGGGKALGAQPVDRRFHLAFIFGQCLLAVHHAGAGALAQFLDGRGGYFSHNLYPLESNPFASSEVEMPGTASLDFARDERK